MVTLEDGQTNKMLFFLQPLMSLPEVVSPELDPGEGCGCLSTKCSVSSFSTSITLSSVNHEYNMAHIMRQKKRRRHPEETLFSRQV